MLDELKSMIGPNERIFYEGKPDKKCFIIESIFNPLLPFAIVWTIFDTFFLREAFGGGMLLLFIPFILLHMMPVWIYLAGVLFSYRKYKNTNYIITDHAVYASSGIFTRRLAVKTFAEASHINLHRGIFDQMFNVGDIQITSNQFTANRFAANFFAANPFTQNMSAMVQLNSIAEYAEVYQLLKNLQKDIYSDIMYPNDFRPRENHGYNTRYRP